MIGLSHRTWLRYSLSLSPTEFMERPVQQSFLRLFKHVIVRAYPRNTNSYPLKSPLLAAMSWIVDGINHQNHGNRQLILWPVVLTCCSLSSSPLHHFSCRLAMAMTCCGTCIALPRPQCCPSMELPEAPIAAASRVPLQAPVLGDIMGFQCCG